MSYTVTDGRHVVPNRQVNSFVDGTSLRGRRSNIGQLDVILHALWFYTIGLIAALFAALIGAALAGIICSGFAAFAFDTWFYFVGLPVEQVYETGYNARRHFTNSVSLTGVAAVTTFSFCVACLRVFPNKGQIQSLIVLELAALPGIFAIAGDARSTDDYSLMFVGCGVLLSIALLALRFPHWIYLAQRNP